MRKIVLLLEKVKRGRARQVAARFGSDDSNRGSSDCCFNGISSSNDVDFRTDYDDTGIAENCSVGNSIDLCLTYARGPRLDF